LGLPQKSPLTSVTGSRGARRGIALPTAMFALVAASILLAGALAFANLSVRATGNQERATRALHVADAGMAHAVSLLRASPLKSLSFTRILRGADNLIGTAAERADDSLFINYAGLAAGDQIPLAGKVFQGSTYFVSVRDDPIDGDANAATDLNGRVLLRCRSLMPDGSTAEVAAIVGAVPMPGIAADGNLAFAGNPDILGPCGGVHSNGNVSSTGGGPTIGTQATATGTVTGNWSLPDGSAAPKLGGRPPIDIPDLSPATYCAGADYNLTAAGQMINTATGLPVPLVGTGWTYTAGTLTWTQAGAPGIPPDGTYCVTGNAWVTGIVGSAATPKPMSIIASGSIRIEGTPVLVPDHPDNILALAGGDIYLAGNAAGGVNNYSGLIYAGAQCIALGNFSMSGQLMCANGAQPAGATEWTAVHSVSGNFTINFDCSGNVFNKRRVLYWFPRIGA
jgi:hypothetical protein